MPHTIQLYKIPTKHSFECLKKQSKQYTVVTITEGGTSQDTEPEKTGKLLSHHLCLQLPSEG